MDEIHQHWVKLQASVQQTEFKELIRCVHNMAGSAGSFGLMQLSEQARELEKALIRLRDEQGDSQEHASIEVMLDAISELASQAVQRE